MSHSHRPRVARAAVLALAFVVLAAQVAWARGAVCVAARQAHEACKCCEERATAPSPVIAGDCCAVEEAPQAPGGQGAVAVMPGPGAPVVVLPAVVTVPAVRDVLVRETVAEVEARCAGPPLWLRLRTLRL